MTISQHPSQPVDSSSVGLNAVNGAPVVPQQLPDVAKMRAELERLMGKPDAPEPEKQQGSSPQQ